MNIATIKGMKQPVRNKPEIPKEKMPVEAVKWWQADITFGKAIPDKIKEGFYLELQTLIKAGVDMRSALDLIIMQQKKAKFISIFKIIQADIINGSSLSDAVLNHKGFTPYESLSIKIGEETGRLQDVLEDLSKYFQKKIKQRRQVMAALSYPIIVMTVAVLAVVFMANFVVPMFGDIFKRFGNGELPVLTRMVINGSATLRKFSGLWLLILFSIGGFAWANRKKDWFRKISTTVLLKIPVAGELISKIYLARVANSLALLTGAGVPMLQAIALVRQMISFYPIQTSLLDVETQLLKGKSLHACLAAYNIYPAKMVALVKVGEEVNQLSSFFKRINEQYTDEIEHNTAVLSTLMEPFIIIFLGLVVGLILIAMYLPLFKLGSSLG
jgi:type IV pilus assembly protein PilC